MLSGLSKKLPILRKGEKERIFKALDENDVLVLSADTGAGKTTWVPSFLVEYFGYKERVVCTQPRVLPVVGLAHKVAEQAAVQVGHEIGFQHRGVRKHRGQDTKLLFMTEGILVQKFLGDRDQDEFRGFILDEAHERNLETDMLLLMIRDMLTRRGDAKAIVMSATADTEKFKRYFSKAGLRTGYIHVSGQTFPVEHVFTKAPVKDYVSACVDKAIEICSKPVPKGRADLDDVLVFFAAKAELDRGYNLFQKKAARLPAGSTAAGYKLSADTPPEESQVHTDPEEHGGMASELGVARKVIFTTPVAETSITVPTLSYVVDSGMALVQGYDDVAGIPFLEKKLVSRANIGQRAGRVGRVRPGTCFHMYTEAQHKALDEYASPAVHTTDIGGLLLNVLAANAETMNLLQLFRDYLKRMIDPPRKSTVETVLGRLDILGATDPKTTAITPSGLCLADMSIFGPEMAHAVLTAKKYGGTALLEDMVALAALSMEIKRVDEIFVLDDGITGERAWPGSTKMGTDAEILLDVFDKYRRRAKGDGWRHKAGDWARQNGLHAKKLERARQTYADTFRKLDERILECVPRKGDGATRVACIRDSFAANIALWSKDAKRHELRGKTPVVFGKSWVFPHLAKKLVGKSYVFAFMSRGADGKMTSSLVFTS